MNVELCGSPLQVRAARQTCRTYTHFSTAKAVFGDTQVMQGNVKMWIKKYIQSDAHIGNTLINN